MAKKVGYIGGVWDLFHIGHINILRNCKSICDKLIVGITTDKLVAYKHKEAVIPYNKRAEIVRNIRFVDCVVPQDITDKVEKSEEDTTKKIKLNLGCWKDYKKGWVNVDIDKTVKTDILADLNKRFPFPDNYTDEIKCNGIYEHIDNPYHFMSELVRVSKKGCKIYMRVPNWSSAGAFTCPEHKRYCTFHTFDHWSIKKGYEIISISDEPTWIGRLFPFIIRKKLSFIINGLIDFLVFRLRVTK